MPKRPAPTPSRLPDRKESATARPEEIGVFEVDVDGKRLRTSAKDEVVINCGKASITLRRNGRVIIRGTHVETHSSGTNRIKGGQVCVN